MGGPWSAQNYLNRVLKPAAVRAGVGVFRRRSGKGEEVESTDVNFQVLRRTCNSATLIRRSHYVTTKNPFPQACVQVR